MSSLKLIPHNGAVLYSKSGELLVGHLVEVGLDNASDTVVSNQNIGLIRLRLDVVQEIIDTLRYLEHGFARTVAAGKVLFCLVELPPVAGCGFITPEVLLYKPLLRSRGDTRDL